MLWADLVEDPTLRSFQQAPEGLNAVRVGLAPDILANRVLDRFVVRQGMVGQGVIGVDLGPRLHVFHDEAAHGLALGVGDNLSLDAVGGPVFHSGHGCLTYGTSACQGLPLLVVLVLPFATHVGLVNLDRTGERSTVFSPGPSLPDAVEHEPGGGLADADITVELHAGNALEAGQFQVDGNGPFAQGNLGVSQCRPGSDAKVLPAVGAPVRHGFSVGSLFGPHASTMAAAPIPVPELIFKPFGRSRFIGEHFQQLNDRNALSVCFSKGLVFRPLHHEKSMQN